MVITNRERWIIRRKDTGTILCGLARQFHFKPIEEIGETAVKTYRSEKQALSSFGMSWHNANFEVEAVKVKESIETVEATELTAEETQRLIKAKQENRLVELSIPIGSTVYMLDECDSPDDYMCYAHDCEDCKYNVWHIRPIEVDNPRLALLLAEYNDGHIFLTKEEAEKALEKKYDSHKM